MAISWKTNEVVRFGGSHGKTLVMIQGRLTITTGGEGGRPDDIPASLFGLDQIYGCGGIISDDETKVWYGVPDNTNKSLITKDPTNTSARGDLAAQDAYNVTVWGSTAT